MKNAGAFVHAGPPYGGAEPQADGTGGFTIDVGDPSGIIVVTGKGVWSPDCMDEHFAALAYWVEDRRARSQAVKVLVDLRGSGAQSAETMERIGIGAMTLYQDGDRVALLVTNSLAKLQMRRVIRTNQHQFFVSPSAARQWLDAYSGVAQATERTKH
jgi:hypothetical protein